MKVWRGTDGDNDPVELECVVFGYPNETTSGEIMYKNTHFRTKAEAWASIRKSCEAGMSLIASSIKHCEAQLAILREEAANEVKRFAGIPLTPNAVLSDNGERRGTQ
jgi:hypothetical protein